MKLTKKVSYFFDIYSNMKSVYENEKFSWKEKYEIIFSEYISRELTKIGNSLGIPFDYNDPNTNHEEDVQAYFEAVSIYAERIRIAYIESKTKSEIIEKILYVKDSNVLNEIHNICKQIS